MRWGRWHRQDRGHLVLHFAGGARLVVELRRLATPVALVRLLLELRSSGITVEDAAHLQIAANELCWQAFCFEGVGDWVDEHGDVRGAAVAHG